ncbi:MAG: hypothetical protein ACREBS_01220 [Nitrososphaerales archaeon]
MSNSDLQSQEEIARNIRRYIAWRNRHHPPVKQPKRVRKEKAHLCGKCGINILEEH